jgi:ribosomal protein S18 acetylase RimI-like enzyme
MVIQKAKKEHAAQIVQLLKYICALHKKGRPDVFISDSPKYNEEEVRRLLDDEKTVIYVALDGDEVTGYLIAELKEGVPSRHMRGIKTLYIDDLCVKETRKRQGIGKALFEQARLIAREYNCERIDLNVWAFNTPAIEFYRKMGLEISRMHMEMKL